MLGLLATPGRSASWQAWALAAVLVGLFAARPADASCGHYVQEDGVIATPTLPAQPPPCRGPSCSGGRPEAPVSAPAVPVRPGDACLTAPLPPPPPESGPRSPWSSPPRPVHHSCPPDPPPRS